MYERLAQFFLEFGHKSGYLDRSRLGLSSGKKLFLNFVFLKKLFALKKSGKKCPSEKLMNNLAR